VAHVSITDTDAARGGVIGALVAAASGLDGCVPAPDALTVWLVLPADLPDGSADAFADMCAPCPELTVGGGCRWWLGVEDVLGVLLEQRIDGVRGPR
jgi:hypothetical protein